MIQNIMENIVFQNSKDMDDLIEKRDAFNCDNKLSDLQPYVVVCGSLTHTESTFVVLKKNVKYKVESTIKAVDLCFKIFFVLRLKYSLGCQYAWAFFHENIHDVKGSKRISASQAVSELNSATQAVEL